MVLDLLRQALRAARKRIGNWSWIGPRLVVEAVSTAQSATCPACRRRSRHIHGRYRRSLAELPSFGQPVTLDVEVVRFRCGNPRCTRRTFSESLEALAQPRQRATDGLAAARTQIAMELGGEAAARLSRRLAMATSGDTMLRLLRRRPPNEMPEPLRVIGIDDWARHRGHTYGTIVVDLERHRPVDLLADRDVATVTRWLTGQRDVEIVARDRAGAYAEAISTALPHAVQVADRWHLIGNLRDAMERLVVRMGSQVRAAARPVPVPQAIDSSAPDPAAPAVPVNRHPAAQRRIDVNRERRIARYAEVRRLYAEGTPLRAIARMVGLDRRTVRNFAHAAAFPERALRVKMPTKADSVMGELVRRAAAGETDAARIWRELAAQGFKGGYRVVQHAFAVLRHRPQHLAERRLAVPAPRRVCAWLLGWPDDASATERDAVVERLVRAEPVIQSAMTLGRQFLAAVRSRERPQMDRWISDAAHGQVPELRRFAAGLRADVDAVRAAVSSPWSSGQVEGQINRLKMLKRQMFGRAKLDLLRIRMLGSPG